jgi:hypothetical protein
MVADPAAYRDPTYLAAVANLKRYPTRCRCGRLATTIDHVPPLALHVHRRGALCCQYRPACTRCNMGAGAHIARLRRLIRRPSASREW